MIEILDSRSSACAPPIVFAGRNRTANWVARESGARLAGFLSTALKL